MTHLFHFTNKDTENDDSEEEILDEEDKYLPKVKPPYLPPKELSMSPYTLVLDLDETLIHFEDVSKFKLKKLNRNKSSMMSRMGKNMKYSTW